MQRSLVSGGSGYIGPRGSDRDTTTINQGAAISYSGDLAAPQDGAAQITESGSERRAYPMQ